MKYLWFLLDNKPKNPRLVVKVDYSVYFMRGLDLYIK